MKFKVGDKVIVKDSCKYGGEEGGTYAGRKGHVLSILKGGYHSWPYRVEFEGGHSDFFRVGELDKIEDPIAILSFEVNP